MRTRRSTMSELDNKVSVEKLKEIASNPNIQRVPGLALFYSELVQGISPFFTHYIDNVPALHTVLLFVSIKSLSISKVPAKERFLFRRVEPHDLRIFRCVVRYGYKDVQKEHESFEDTLVSRLKDFIMEESLKIRSSENGGVAGTVAENVEGEELRIMDADEAAGVEVQLVDNECQKGGFFN